MFRKFAIAVVAVTVMGWAGTAHASTIVFTTSGANSVSGKATFNFGASAFTVTLENLTNPIGLTAQELDGLLFRLTPAGSPSLSSVLAAGIVDCSSDHSYPCAPYVGVVPANDGWGATTSSGVTHLTTTPLGFHPYAIISPSYALPANGNGNLANPQHNPFLVGPVVFTFAGSFTGVSDVTFEWGTAPALTTGNCTLGCGPVVPEPSTMVLFGTGLVGLAARLRRRRR